MVARRAYTGTIEFLEYDHGTRGGFPTMLSTQNSSSITIRDYCQEIGVYQCGGFDATGCP